MTLAILVVAAYLIGSIPFGWIIARARGVDIFQAGSGNIGATNVARVLGRPLGILVFVFDFAKGALPVAVALLATPDFGTTVGVAAGLAAFLGHLFPVFLGFRGGKGIATGAGVVAVLFPTAALAALLAFVGVVAATRIVSLGSLVAAGTLVLVHCLLVNAVDLRDPRTTFALLALALVAFKHRGNIARIRNGTENRVAPNRFLEPTARAMHVLALGLWFGMSVFFSFVTALTLFNEFEALGTNPVRPDWFPRPGLFADVDDVVNAPKEQGARVAGFAVSKIFPTYFLWQTFCGVVGFATALGWPRLRPWLVGLALLLVAVGWPVERHVADLRAVREERTDAYLRADAEGRQALRDETTAARRSFIRWHLVSLLLNLGVIGLVGAATSMAGGLPPRNDEPRRLADAES